MIARYLPAAALAAAAWAAPASAHIIYATSFEPGQSWAGPLRGQDLWSDTPENNYVVTQSNPYIGTQAATFAPGDTGASDATRRTQFILLDPIPGMVVLVLTAQVRLDDIRADTGLSLNISAVAQVPGGVLNIGVLNGRAVASSGAGSGGFFALGPELPRGEYVEISANMDMYTGHTTLMLGETQFGEFHLPIDWIHNLEWSSDINMTSGFTMTSPGSDSMTIDSVRLWHVPAPTSCALLLGLLAVHCRRRRS